MKKIKFTITIAACLLVFNNANSQSSQSAPPLKVRHESVGASWTNLPNVTVLDGPHAICNLDVREFSQAIKATDFDFHVPSTATINGVKVFIAKGSESNAIQDKWVRLVVGNNAIGVSKSEAGGWSTSTYPIYSYYGDNTDLWTIPLSPSDINANGFGLVFKCWNTSYSSSYKAYVDYIQITVYYTVGAKQFQQASFGKVNSEPLSISPNPATDKISFTIDEKESFDADVKVYNIGGGLVINENKVPVGSNESHSTDISNLNPGTYFLRIESPGDKIYTKKFIKK